MAEAGDLKSIAPIGPWGFEPHPTRSGNHPTHLYVLYRIVDVHGQVYMRSVNAKAYTRKSCRKGLSSLLHHDPLAHSRKHTWELCRTVWSRSLFPRPRIFLATEL